VVQSINSGLGPDTAAAVDGRVIRVRAPTDPNQRIAFLAQVENLNVIAGEAPAKVILNGRTGSIVMNQAVQVDTCAVAHGNLSVTISTEPVVSQPPPFSGGQTVVTEQSRIEIKSEKGNLIAVPASVGLSQVVKALNAVGATPQDLLAILQAMKAAGALRAELEII
jgi:flagellar P-ring protein precursor FlgI